MNYYSYSAEDVEDRDGGQDMRLWSTREGAIKAMLEEVNEQAADLDEAKKYPEADIVDGELKVGFMLFSISVFEVQS